ncbi:MAG TPA: hypothetical protein VI278_01970 [Nitrososphaeraceae archaeon]
MMQSIQNRITNHEQSINDAVRAVFSKANIAEGHPTTVPFGLAFKAIYKVLLNMFN